MLLNVPGNGFDEDYVGRGQNVSIHITTTGFLPYPPTLVHYEKWLIHPKKMKNGLHPSIRFECDGAAAELSDFSSEEKRVNGLKPEKYICEVGTGIFIQQLYSTFPLKPYYSLFFTLYILLAFILSLRWPRSLSK